MASKEIKHLSTEMQVLYNKFYDKCRRDTWLLKHGVSVLLSCTYRSPEEQDKLGRKKSKHNLEDVHTLPAAEAFDIFVLQYGELAEPLEVWDRVAAHAAEVGLERSSMRTFQMKD